MGKSSGKLLIYGVLLIVLFLGLIRIFVNGGGNFFRLELIGLFILSLGSFVGFIGYRSNWGERVLFAVFFLYVGNLIAIWYFTGTLFFVLLILALIGFALALPKRQMFQEPEEHSVVFDPVEKKMEKKSNHSPGKFVASKSSNVYHAPKCDWAKRIHKDRRVWFENKDAAWEKGYKGHSCI
jgi:predicted membrane protein